MYSPELLPGVVRQSTLYSKFLNSCSVTRCDRFPGVTISPFSIVHATSSLAFQPVRSFPLKRLIQPSLSSADETPIVPAPHRIIASAITAHRDLVIGVAPGSLEESSVS